MQISAFRGSRTVMSLRLCSRAPWTTSSSAAIEETIVPSERTFASRPSGVGNRALRWRKVVHRHDGRADIGTLCRHMCTAWMSQMSRRFHVTLSDDQYAYLSLASERTSLSVAELVRRAIDEKYPASASSARRPIGSSRSRSGAGRAVRGRGADGLRRRPVGRGAQARPCASGRRRGRRG